MQFEDRAMARLDTLEEIFEDEGATVERRLVFTHDGQQTIDRIITEHDCLAVLVPGATGPPEDVLVAVRGTVGSDRLARVVAGVFGQSDVSVTLFHVAGADETDVDATTLLDAVTDRLTDLGVADAAIETRIDRDDNALNAIIDASQAYDALVMGESDPSLATLIFGMPANQVAKEFLGPVLVVQREPPADEEDEA